MISTKVVKTLVNERIEELDNELFIVDISITDSNTINIAVDGLHGVSVKDCVSISRNVEHNLDREEHDFELHVSSAGLDQPFKVLQQYEKNVGRNVEIKLKEGDKLEGLLKSVDEEGVIIETRHKERVESKKKKVEIVQEHRISFDSIIETKVVISFN